MGVRLVVAAVLVTWLAACAQAPTPPDRFLRLVPRPPAALAAPVLRGTLLVKRFAADGVLAQRPVLYAPAGSPEVLRQYNYHFWAEPPPVMMQEAVMDALRAAAVARQVVLPQHGVAADFVLVGRLRRLEHLVGESGAVALSLELGVQDASSRALLLLKTYPVTLPVQDAGVEAAAGALSIALSQILARFTADLQAVR